MSLVVVRRGPRRDLARPDTPGSRPVRGAPALPPRGLRSRPVRALPAAGPRLNACRAPSSSNPRSPSMPRVSPGWSPGAPGIRGLPGSRPLPAAPPGLPGPSAGARCPARLRPAARRERGNRPRRGARRHRARPYRGARRCGGGRPGRGVPRCRAARPYHGDPHDAGPSVPRDPSGPCGLTASCLPLAAREPLRYPGEAAGQGTFSRSGQGAGPVVVSGFREPSDQIAPCRVLVALPALRVIPVRHVPTDVRIEACSHDSRRWCNAGRVNLRSTGAYSPMPAGLSRRRIKIPYGRARRVSSQRCRFSAAAASGRSSTAAIASGRMPMACAASKRSHSRRSRPSRAAWTRTGRPPCRALRLAPRPRPRSPP